METHFGTISRGMLLRMAADAAMVQVALLAALATRLFWQIAFFDRDYPTGYGELAQSYLSFYANNTLVLTGVVLVTLYMMGVYRIRGSSG